MIQPDEQAYLDQFYAYLAERVAPMAPQMDRDSESLRVGFEEFKAEGGLTLRMPRAVGGRALSDLGFAQYRIQLARYCGALSFLQAQHQVAVSWLAQSRESHPVYALYPKIVQDGVALGIGFLSPRHQSFEVKQEGSTYILSGEIPWVTGHGFLQHIVTSFQADGYRHFLILPFHNTSNASGQLAYSEPLPLIVFNALNTVRARLTEWTVQPDDIFLSLPLVSDAKPERHNSVYTLAGVAKGLQDAVCQLSDLPQGMRDESQRLERLLDQYIDKVMSDGSTPAALRAEGARIAQDWSGLARWAYGGKALLLDHPVNRLSREVWQYCVAGLRPDDLDVVYPG